MAKNNKTHAIRRQNSRHKAAKVCTARSKFVFLKNGQKKLAKKGSKKGGKKGSKNVARKVGKKFIPELFQLLS